MKNYKIQITMPARGYDFVCAVMHLVTESVVKGEKEGRMNRRLRDGTTELDAEWRITMTPNDPSSATAAGNARAAATIADKLPEPSACPAGRRFAAALWLGDNIVIANSI